MTAQQLIDDNLYLTLGTADERGHPWTSPVYYAPSGYEEFFWVSAPEAQHSRNIAARPAVSMVIFDSRQPIGTGQGVYMRAVAGELTGDELLRGVDVFSQRLVAHGEREWTLADVQPPARLRMYRAVAQEHYVLRDDRDERIRVSVT